MTEHTVDPERRTQAITLGLDTFGDVHTDSSGTRLSNAQTIRNLVDEGVLAEATGVDYFGIGEHHTESFPLSAGESGHLSTWIGVGGSPEPVVRAARYGFALMIAIIGGETARFAPFAGARHDGVASRPHRRPSLSFHMRRSVTGTRSRLCGGLRPDPNVLSRMCSRR